VVFLRLRRGESHALTEKVAWAYRVVTNSSLCSIGFVGLEYKITPEVNIKEKIRVIFLLIYSLCLDLDLRLQCQKIVIGE